MYVPELHEGLEPCPHCGASAFVVNFISYYRARCSSGDCAASGGSSPTIQGAKDLWNRRVDKPKYKFPISIKSAVDSLGLTEEEYSKLVDQLFEEEIFNDGKETSVDPEDS